MARNHEELVGEEATVETFPIGEARDVKSSLFEAIPNPYKYALYDKGCKATVAFFLRFLLAAAAGGACIWLNQVAISSFATPGTPAAPCYTRATIELDWPDSLDSLIEFLHLYTFLCSYVGTDNTGNDTRLFPSKQNTTDDGCTLYGYNGTPFFINSTKEVYFFNLGSGRDPYAVDVPPEKVSIDCLRNSTDFDPEERIEDIKGSDACGLEPWTPDGTVYSLILVPLLVWFVATFLDLVYESALLVTIYSKSYMGAGAGELCLMVQGWEGSSNSIPSLVSALRMLASTRILLPLGSFAVVSGCSDFSTLQGNPVVLAFVFLVWSFIPLVFVSLLLKYVSCGRYGATHTLIERSSRICAALSLPLYLSYVLGDLAYVTSFFTVSSVDSIGKISFSADRLNLARLVLVVSATILFVWDGIEDLESFVRRCKNKKH
eukprot:gb/GECG01006193.1/.p1 GENE.gb/GECG01006193.1/~~gb/GECG01006193.1/.p1  ORF type:complete len:433 (+),score=22.40 gb/GECG01006193.1/:1-1299(+)